MDAQRLPTRTMLQRVVTLTKHTNELQTLTTLPVPIWSGSWHRQASTNSEIGGGISSQSPRGAGGPSYALSPPRRFEFSRSQKALQLELDRRCSRISKTLRYDPKQCLDLVRDLSQQLRRTLKPDSSTNSRYKLVVMVTIVQIKPHRQIHQSMSVVSRCLWDCETDGSITAHAKLGHDMLATATAFAVYTD